MYTEEYLPYTGAYDQERLSLLSEIYDEGSRQFVSGLMPKDKVRLLDIGCGHGQMAFWLAEKYPNCEVVAIDSAQEQIDICNAYKKEKKLSNVNFKLHDISQSALDNEHFDIVYLRFILMHIKDWDTCINNILNSSKEGALILVEESGFPYECWPNNKDFKRANDLVKELAQKTGLNYDCFPKLWEYVQNLDVNIHSIRFNLPALITNRQKRFPLLSFEQIRQPLISVGLVSAQEIDELILEMRKLACNPKYLIGSWRMMQLAFIKK